MPVIVKIMECGNLLADSDNRASYQLFTGVHSVMFTRDLTGQAFICIHFDQNPAQIGESTPGDVAGTNIHRELHTPVYVMSEAGKTISSYDGRPTGVQVSFNGTPRTLAQGPMTMAYLRQVLSLDGNANLYRKIARGDSLYGRTSPLNVSVPRGDVWETVGDGDATVYLVTNETFVTTLPKGAVLDDPAPLNAA